MNIPAVIYGAILGGSFTFACMLFLSRRPSLQEKIIRIWQRLTKDFVEKEPMPYVDPSAAHARIITNSSASSN